MTLHLVVPDGIDDPNRPSGGNLYDRRVADALRATGREVVEHPVAGGWPTPDTAAAGRLATALAAVPDGATVLVDGLVASASPGVLLPAARRLALGVLVHLPLGVASPAARPAEREVLRAAATVVATSGWTRDWLQQTYGLARVDVAPPGAEPAPVASGSGGGGALLCVGRACEAKGYDVLAAALTSLTDLAWTCTWVGPGDVGAEGPITLTGPLPPDAVAEHYRAADLVLLPSRFETYGMVVTESLARGVPVVASDVGGVREAIGLTSDGQVPGILVPPGDAGSLAGALRRWLCDADLRHRLRVAALDRRAALRGWDDTARRLAAALPTVLGAAS